MLIRPYSGRRLPRFRGPVLTAPALGRSVVVGASLRGENHSPRERVPRWRAPLDGAAAHDNGNRFAGRHGHLCYGSEPRRDGVGNIKPDNQRLAGRCECVEGFHCAAIAGARPRKRFRCAGHVAFRVAASGPLASVGAATPSVAGAVVRRLVRHSTFPTHAVRVTCGGLAGVYASDGAGSDEPAYRLVAALGRLRPVATPSRVAGATRSDAGTSGRERAPCAAMSRPEGRLSQPRLSRARQTATLRAPRGYSGL